MPVEAVVVQTTPQDPATTPIKAPVSVSVPDVVIPAPANPAPPAAPAGTPGGAPSASQGPRVVTLAGDGDEIPEDAELFSLSRTALNSRLARHTRRELRDRFGTDNPEEIKAKLDKLAQYEKQAEEQRLASLSEIERERELRVKAENESEEWRQKYSSARDAQEIGQAHSRIDGIAGQHLKPKVKGVVMELFRDHLRTKSEAEIDAMTDEQIGAWFAEQVRETPEFGRDYQAAPVVQPLTNGVRAASQDRAAPQTGAHPEPNYSPSAPNALSSQEARVKGRREGYDW